MAQNDAISILCFDDIQAALDNEGCENPELINNSGNLAYVMYTSGTTGKPKGNLTTHYNITRVVKNSNYIEIKNSDCLLQLSNYAFDGSTFDRQG
jgi:non-ribosomal peptide synthetase component F